MTAQVNSLDDGILDPKGEGKSVAIDSANFDAAMLNILEDCWEEDDVALNVITTACFSRRLGKGGSLTALGLHSALSQRTADVLSFETLEELLRSCDQAAENGPTAKVSFELSTGAPAASRALVQQLVELANITVGIICLFDSSEYNEDNGGLEVFKFDYRAEAVFSAEQPNFYSGTRKHRARN